MARQFRIEYAGALYHIASRGNARKAIYQNDDNRTEFLSLLDTTCNRFNWYCHAYCLMNNHYHLLIETNTPSLSKGIPCKLDPDHSLNDIPKKQKQAAIKPLGYYQQRYPSRSEAMAKAYLADHYTLMSAMQQ